MTRILLSFLLVFTAVFPAAGAGKSERMAPQPDFVKIIASWSGDTSAAELEALPQWRPRLGGGCIGDEAAFATFWGVFKPGTIPPRVDFKTNMVVFVARKAVYEQLNVVKVTLKDGVVEVVANGNRADHPPRTDRRSVAAAVIPRSGIKFLRVGDKEEPLEP